MLQISQRLYKLSEENGHQCYWCDGYVILTGDLTHPMAATREHLIPKANRARYDESNIVLAHRLCNAIRATMDAESFKALMQGEAKTKYDLWPHIYQKEKN